MNSQIFSYKKKIGIFTEFYCNSGNFLKILSDYFLSCYIGY